jgi:hypothetical protein
LTAAALDVGDALEQFQAKEKTATDKAAAEALATQQAAQAKLAPAKKTTISCVKGKIVKTFVGLKPTCPVRYKKK